LGRGLTIARPALGTTRLRRSGRTTLRVWVELASLGVIISGMHHQPTIWADRDLHTDPLGVRERQLHPWRLPGRG